MRYQDALPVELEGALLLCGFIRENSSLSHPGSLLNVGAVSSLGGIRKTGTLLFSG